SPSRAAAVARLAIPPGLEPMPLDQSSSPGRGRRSMPVKTMSKKTVPDNSTSSGGYSGGSWAGSGAQSERPAAPGGAGVEEPVAPVVQGTGAGSVVIWRLLRASRGWNGVGGTGTG